MGIIWDDNYIFIVFWDKKYLYSLSSKTDIEVLLNIGVNYVKKAASNSSFHFVTEKWSFIYDRNRETLEYFSYFDDFVYYNDEYIWVIKKEDKRRLKNLWLDDENDNLIVKYNPGTKEKKVLHRILQIIIMIFANALWKLVY